MNVLGRSIVVSLSLVLAWAAAAQGADGLILSLEYQDTNGTPVTTQKWIDPAQTAIVVVDMWNAHWCTAFTDRLPELFAPMNESLEIARQLGIQIVYAPADVNVTNPYSHWASTTYRTDWAGIPDVPQPYTRRFAAGDTMPFYSPTYGASPFCQCDPNVMPGWPCVSFAAATDQVQAITDGMRVGDLITDSGQELYNLTQARGIKTLLYTGVASNWCVWNRPFGMGAMYQAGLDTYLVRDLVQSFSGDHYNPEGDGAFGVSNADFTPAIGDQIVVNHYERNGIGTVSRTQLSGPLVPELPAAKNLALGKPTRSSSAYYYPGGYSQDADNAVDGQVSGDYLMCSDTGDYSPYWEVDLEQMHVIDYITIWGHQSCTYRLAGATLEILDDSRNVTYTTTLDDLLHQMIYPIKDTSGRYVRISKTGEYLDFNEVEVYGTVPEPATLGLLAVGSLALLKRRR